MNLKEGITKKLIRAMGVTAPLWDVIFSPLTLVAIVWFRIIRYWGVKRMKASKTLFLKLGLFPIVNHYYEPLFDAGKIGTKAKSISHLDFNDEAQLACLSYFRCGSELLSIPNKKTNLAEYYDGNGSFDSGDSELYYSIIRRNKPFRIVEIGSGFSTFIALRAIDLNKQEDPTYHCELICVEPYEMPYLDTLNITLIRQKVEDVDHAIFTNLNKNDILFVDSSHIIRPGGDVTHLILKILPMISGGVWIHFHDIFLPQEYPVSWMRDEFRMWNEQYLLEGFLIGNSDFEIVLALNYMKRKYPSQIDMAFPLLSSQPDHEPASFWIRRK